MYYVLLLNDKSIIEGIFGNNSEDAKQRFIANNPQYNKGNIVDIKKEIAGIIYR